VSPIVVFEAVLGMRRKAECDISEARAMLDRFIGEVRAEVMPIDTEIGLTAIQAHARFGKGHHKASLNMGDCFAYACAKRRGIPLLFKGDDFIHTDIAIS